MSVLDSVEFGRPVATFVTILCENLHPPIESEKNLLNGQTGVISIVPIGFVLRLLEQVFRTSEQVPRLSDTKVSDYLRYQKVTFFLKLVFQGKFSLEKNQVYLKSDYLGTCPEKCWKNEHLRSRIIRAVCLPGKFPNPRCRGTGS